MTKNKRIISITAPAWNEAENLVHLYERLTSVLKQLDYDYEILIVDDNPMNREILRDLLIGFNCELSESTNVEIYRGAAGLFDGSRVGTVDVVVFASRLPATAVVQR